MTPDGLGALADFPPETLRLAAWSELPPLDLGPPKAFTLERGLKALRGLHATWQRDFRAPEKLWGKAIAPSLGREEALFWWEALSRLSWSERPNSVAESLERVGIPERSEEELAEGIKADGAEREIRWPTGREGAEVTLKVLRGLMAPDAILKLLIARLDQARCWRKTEQAPPNATAWLIAACARQLLPYLPSASLAALRARLERELDPKHWPERGQPSAAGFSWYLAGLIGAPEACGRLVETWSDGHFLGEGHDGWYQRPLIPLLGLRDPERIVREAKRLGVAPRSPFELELWLALTGERGAPLACEVVLGESSYSISDFAKVFLRLRGPAVVPQVVALRSKRSTSKAAERWLKQHPEESARGLLRLVAAGGAQLAEAQDLLLKLQEEQPAAYAAAIAAEAADPYLIAALEAEAAGPEDALPLEQLPPGLRGALAAVAALPKPKKSLEATWLSLRRLPPPTLGGRPLGEEALGLLIRACQEAPLEVRPPGPAPELLAELRATAEPASLEAFAWELFQGWLRAGAAPGQKWVMSGLGHLGGERVVRELTPLVRAWPGQSQHARAVLGLEVLRQIGSDAALGAIAGIAAKLKFRALKERAGECMDMIAAGRGLSREELGDRLVPECGLDAAGERVFDYGPRAFHFVLGPELKPMVRDPAGKLLKAPPKPAKSDDPQRSAEALSEWKVFKKTLTDALKLQVSRLEQAMVEGRKWSSADFDAILVRHPLQRHLVRALLWASYEAGAAQPFRVDEAGARRDLEGTLLQPGSAPVGIVHPLELSEAERARGDALWDQLGLLAPFPQLDREVFHLEPAALQGNALEPAQAGDEGPWQITPRKLRGVLLGAGWLRGAPQDAGIVSEHVRHFATANVTAVLQHEGISVDGYDPWEFAPVERCVFLEGIQELWDCAWVRPEEALPLSEVTPVVLSEVLRDLKLLAETAE